MHAETAPARSTADRDRLATENDRLAYWAVRMSRADITNVRQVAIER